MAANMSWGAFGKAKDLQNRILFHVSHKMGDENKLMVHHQRLTDSQHDQLSLAAIHFFTTWHDTVRQSLFQVVSILTTTGFGASDYLLWPPVGHGCGPVPGDQDLPSSALTCGRMALSAVASWLPVAPAP